ncbi:MAG: hypothetical protein QXS95_02330 [Candidatus Nitrosocaldus sp.]
MQVKEGIGCGRSGGYMGCKNWFSTITIDHDRWLNGGDGLDGEC